MLPLTQGSHHVTTGEGLASAWNVDRLVLSSNDAGRPGSGHAGGCADHRVGRAVRITDTTADSYHLRVRTDGTPFWLVLGQSHNDGWEATANGRSLGTPHLVNGFANGWTVHPGKAGTIDIVLRWTPQRSVWIGLSCRASRCSRACSWCSSVAGAQSRCVGPELHDAPSAVSPATFAGVAPSTGMVLGAAVTAGVATALVSRWWIGVIVAAATALSPWIARGRLVLAAGAPIALALGALFDVPELGWVAIGLLIGDLVAGWWWSGATAILRTTAPSSAASANGPDR